jgi:hypothetical protein
MATNNPKSVTFYGRLSYPTFTAQEAYVRSLKGSYPADDVASAAPDFLLLVTEAQFKKVLDHCVNVFLPYCKEQHDKGEKRDALEAGEVKKLIESIQGDLADQVYNSPFKPVSDKTADLAPDAVAAVKVIGSKGEDFILKAIVNDESELSVPDPDILQFPVIKPLSATTHQMYPGAVVAVTVNLYAYRNGKLPGFSAGANVAVFRSDAERFGGGVDVDTDEIFLD